MATKKDLVEAQGFSRRRLLSAFSGGAPGGKELEPAKPLRAVIAGITLSAMVILGGLFFGLVRPGLPQGWENNRLIVAKDSGARYLSVDGTLHPVINTVSARLLIPAKEFSVLTVDQGALNKIPVGSTIGIPGGPDVLPSRKSLEVDAWTARVVGQGTELTIGDRTAKPAKETEGIVVSRDQDLFVIAGGTRYPVDPAQSTSVLRAVGLDTQTPLPVTGDWLNLFAAGDPLAPLNVEGAGTLVPGINLPAGSVIRQMGAASDDRYLLLDNGTLAPLTPIAYRLALLGNAAAYGEEVQRPPADLAGLPTAKNAGGQVWPSRVLTPLAGIEQGTVQATFLASRDGRSTVLAQPGPAPSARDADRVESSVSVARGSGALVRGGRAGTVTVVDSTGIAYAVPGATSDIIAQLGYEDKDVTTIPAPWLRMIPSGPELSAQAAATTPVSGG
ncbi:type VII secretion protein EccB [Mycetocola lacteus]|uniref:Type VII secretion protein EccB n=1 Tax=Mycetocola lacteus TaxID=76637 RepID=A0A3L7ANV9_9MICO|nr:type VII secretion protein EccB [Mycetocola lacteus]RLP82037.1 type VII secretion protein EccB [Mycetocola lacteus]